MNSAEFISKFKEQLQGHDGSDITLDTIFRDLDAWDSMTGMAVQLIMNDDLNANISDEDFLACKTVSDLYKYVN